MHGSGRLHLHGVSAQDRERIINAINQEQATIGGAAGADMLRVMHADIVRQYGTLAAFDRQLRLQLVRVGGKGLRVAGVARGEELGLAPLTWWRLTASTSCSW